MFAADAAAAAPAVEELNVALQWVEGELSKSEGPLFMGKDLTLVRGRGGVCGRRRVTDNALRALLSSKT